MSGQRISWPAVVERAAQIAGSYSTAVTLRQLHYRLVSEHLIPNTDVSYKTLSARTAEARREGWFPQLLDQGREIQRPWHSDDPVDAVQSLADDYRRDRTEDQDEQLWVVLEKATLLEQVTSWVDEYGVPVVALRGYGSQTIKDEVRHAVAYDGRSALALYVGDLDPTGVDIERDFHERTDWCFDDITRLAVNYEQVAEYGLVPAPGKASDSRAASFVAAYGELIQVEVEAIDPATLEGLVRSAVDARIDHEALGQVREREERERDAIQGAAEHLASVFNGPNEEED